MVIFFVQVTFGFVFGTEFRVKSLLLGGVVFCLGET
jgi:hypothetical protein